MFGSAILALRRARITRYDSAAAHAAFREARDAYVGAGTTLAALALLPIVVAAV